MLRSLLSITLLAAVALPAAAQNRSAADFHWDKAVAAGGTVSIHNLNGNIKVLPSNTGRVEVVGIRRGDSRATDRLKVDVQESSGGINICVLDQDADAYCDDRGMHSNSRNSGRDWNEGQINLEVSLPANLLVHPSTVSGDIDVTGAHGDLTANSVSGDIVLDKLRAGSVRVNSVSGDITVHVDEFTSRGDLSFRSVSGDVVLDLPRDFAADLSMSTVSGDINSDFPITIGNGRMSRRTLNARIGAGGRRLDVSTVSGDLRLKTNGR